ncbi:phosphotriesterase family protein [Microbacterium suaedae]|uniref:phosphotriesterase family protein n=1 Tax=Microbacterium suaedae TaxID=2067813 RepID=UPI000DA1BCF0|nr:phosphotriesterase [Microbacterium suaedae]
MSARPVPTFTGDVAPAALGETLLHEHVFVGGGEIDLAAPSAEWAERDHIAEAVRQLDGLHDRGVRTVVDLTVPGLGRDVRRVQRVAEATRVRIVAATGWYTHDVLPPYFRLNGPGLLVDGPDPLAELFVDDLTRGIQGTPVRAGAIKVVSDAAGVTDDVRRVFAAAAVAHAETGAPIFTHSHSPSRGGLPQQEMLRARGVSLDRVVIGHAGDSDDVSYLVELAAEGSLLGFDRFGMEHAAPDAQRVRTLLELLERGLAPRIALSHDAAVFSRVTPPSWRRARAPHWHLHHLHDRILPELRARGVGEDDIRTMLVDNPRRLLANDREPVR